MWQAVGVGFEDERAQEWELHGSEAAFGFAVEGLGGPVGKCQGLLEWGEVAAVGSGDVGTLWIPYPRIGTLRQAQGRLRGTRFGGCVSNGKCCDLSTARYALRSR